MIFPWGFPSLLQLLKSNLGKMFDKSGMGCIGIAFEGILLACKPHSNNFWILFSKC